MRAGNHGAKPRGSFVLKRKCGAEPRGSFPSGINPMARCFEGRAWGLNSVARYRRAKPGGSLVLRRKCGVKPRGSL